MVIGSWLKAHGQGAKGGRPGPRARGRSGPSPGLGGLPWALGSGRHPLAMSHTKNMQNDARKVAKWSPKCYNGVSKPLESKKNTKKGFQKC